MLVLLGIYWAVAYFLNPTRNFDDQSSLLGEIVSILTNVEAI